MSTQQLLSRAKMCLGAADYVLHPKYRVSWGGPFNGQTGRRAIFESLMRVQQPDLILETGTYRGTTTEVFAAAANRVVTIEAQPRYYGYSRVRLRKFPNVDIRLGDSRTEIARLVDEIGPSTQGKLFAYLDAHWFGDLPLAKEVDLIFRWDPEAIVMVDDFQVPDDDGYSYDDYGPGSALTPEYIDPVCSSHGLIKLYPAQPAAEETGARRGAVVLASDARWADVLTRACALRRIQ